MTGPIVIAVLVALGAGLVWALRKRRANASRKVKALLWALAGLDLLALIGMAMLWRPSGDVPDGGKVTEAIDAEVDPLEIRLPAQGPEPELYFRSLAGKTTFFFLDSMKSQKEGTDLRRAVNRWQLPETVVGYYVGDAPEMPAMLLSTMEEKFLGFMRAESPWPIYVDTQGVVVDTYKLPRGHLGFLVLGPQGDILMRHSGDADEAKLEEIRDLLGASEPPPPPPAPEFSEAGFDKAACAKAPCAFIFLDQDIARSDIPRIEGGFEDEDAKKVWGQALLPGVRLAGLAMSSWKLEPEKNQGLVIGVIEDMPEIEENGWEQVDEAAALREAFGLGEEDAALVVVDREGRLAFKEVGLIRFWQMGLAGHIMNLEARDMEEPE